MKTSPFAVWPLAVALALAGCGTGYKPSSAPQGPPVLPPSQTTRAPAAGAPATAEAPYAKEALTHEQLMKGIREHIQLEQTALPSPDGNTYMGYTSDRSEPGNKFVSLVVYGTPERVTRCYLYATLPYKEYPDPKDQPDFMKRNVKILDAFLSNVCGGTVPEELRKALEWAVSSPGEERVIYAGGHSVKVSYTKEDKKMCLDVR